MSQNKILFHLTGSIACYKACGLISELFQAGYQVQTVCTKEALSFVGPATLEGLTQRAPYTNVFEAGRAMDHIELARWPDLHLVCPATANTINRLAAGLGDDPVGAIFLANNFQKPWWMAPAMNSQMWLHPATTAAVGHLRDWGVRFLGPAQGNLACGEFGPGRLLEVTSLFEEIKLHFARGVK